MATEQVYLLDGPTEFYFPYLVRLEPRGGAQLDQCAALCELAAGAPGGSMFMQPLYAPTTYV